MGCSPSKAKEKSKSESDPVGRESDATVESRVQLHHPEAIADQTAPKSDKEKRKSDLSTSSRYSRGSMDMLLKVQDFGKQLDKMEEDLKAIESSIAVISNENKMIESREDLLKIKNKVSVIATIFSLSLYSALYCTSKLLVKYACAYVEFLTFLYQKKHVVGIVLG